MTLWQAFLLGLIQGMTEFLPISSSGHLALSQYFFGFEYLQDYVLFNLICHLGTLIAVISTFFPLIKASLTTEKKFFWQILLGTLPLFPLVFILKPLKQLFNHLEWLGPCFVVSAGMLFVSQYCRFPFSFKHKTRRHWQEPLAIGLFQAVAILPGISRSGTTISAARLLGWDKEKAIQFSFLLAIPAILGGLILEGWQAWTISDQAWINLNPWTFIVGFFTSGLVGYVSLWAFIRLAIQNKWDYFAWYCLLLGIGTTIYFNLYNYGSQI